MKRLLSLLCLALLPLAALAEPPDIASGMQFLKRWLVALQQHDAKTLDMLIDNGIRLQVKWMDADPPRSFTLTKADYLQQIRAGWHFYTDERYEAGEVAWQPAPDGQGLVARLRLKQSRLFFGKPTGQSDDLELRIGPVNQSLRLLGMRTQTHMW